MARFPVVICWFLGGLLLSGAAWRCGSPVHYEVEPAFYHWKSRWEPDSLMSKRLQQLGVQHLYVRFFDVDWDESLQAAVPKAPLNWQAADWEGQELIPTIYLTNRSVQRLPRAEVAPLAARIWQKIQQISDGLPFSEVQLDCDWSESSQEMYFALLEALREQAGSEIQLSATIRLHQIKYWQKTGVPPVERGMLMCYNMGDLRDTATVNSILDVETTKAYLVNFESYPLPLDLALPIFRWGVLIRNGQPIRLLNQWEESELGDTSRFEFPHPERILVRKSTYLNGLYLYQGDEIRVESVSVAQLQETLRLLRPIWPTQQFRLTFYHLDPSHLNRYSHEELAALLELFP
jgi:hypothetical protein